MRYRNSVVSATMLLLLRLPCRRLSLNLLMSFVWLLSYCCSCCCLNTVSVCRASGRRFASDDTSASSLAHDQGVAADQEAQEAGEEEEADEEATQPPSAGTSTDPSNAEAAATSLPEPHAQAGSQEDGSSTQADSTAAGKEGDGSSQQSAGKLDWETRRLGVQLARMMGEVQVPAGADDAGRAKQ